MKPQDLSARLCGFIQILSLFGGLDSLPQRPCAVWRTLTATGADYQESKPVLELTPQKMNFRPNCICLAVRAP